MVGGLGNQLFQTAAFLKYRSKKEKVIISFLGDIHIPKRENCLNYIFEIPDWLYYDNSRKINLFTRFLARTSAGLRFGSFAPYIGVNDRNFYLKNSYFFNKKILFFDGYFIHNWKYEQINELFSQLKLRPISLNKEHIKICNENVIIHVRGGDFLKIKQLNICDNYYYKKAIEYALRKGFNTFKVISEDRQYAKEIIKEMKKYFVDLKISILRSNSIKNDFNIIRSSKLAILSNSTFSWWGAWLGKSKDQVIVPPFWFGRGGPRDIEDLIPDRWEVLT